MKAAIQHHYGAPDVLQLADVPRPKVGRKEILVEVRARDVTEGDRRIRAGDFPGMTALLGRLLFGIFRPRSPTGGTMFAGRVVESGKSVTGFEVGQDVFGTVTRGAYAEYLVVPANGSVTHMPEGFSYAEAAALTYGGGTACYFLDELAQVQTGERVLIIGGTGGVGRMAIQIAKQRGAWVTAVCGRNPELAERLGADEVIVRHDENVAKRSERWDVILDTTEGDHFKSFLPILSRTGRYLSLYMSPRLLGQMLLTQLRQGPRALTGVALDSRPRLDALKGLAQAGSLRPIIFGVFPLEEVAEAHRTLQSGRPAGSIIVGDPTSPPLAHSTLTSKSEPPVAHSDATNTSTPPLAHSMATSAAISSGESTR